MRLWLVLVIAFSIGGCTLSPPPGDDEMIRTFEAHRQTFEQLVSMACRDHYETVSINPEWSKPENLPASQKRQYYKLFRTIGVTQLQSYDGCRAQLSVWSVGLGGSGDYKDYQYRPERVENQVASLDHLVLGDKIQFFYRKIAPDWYISYAHWP